MQQAAASIEVAEANLEQGQADLNEAERNFNRSRELLAKSFVSQAAHDTAVARLEKARAALSGYRASVAVAQANYRVAQVAVEQTLIRAPFDGVVLTKNANVGDVITPFSSALGSQAAVVTMADMTTLEVEADVSESNLGKVRLDQPCEIQLDALADVRFRGRLVRLVPTVDRTKATVMAKIRFDELDPRILPDMGVKVTFLREAADANDGESARSVALVPKGAIRTEGEQSYIFVVQGDVVDRRAVKIGGTDGDRLEVLAGVQSGDRVVVSPAAELTSGAQVTVK
jgi:RND family efflux transporter MFP subunit